MTAAVPMVVHPNSVSTIWYPTNIACEQTTPGGGGGGGGCGGNIVHKPSYGWHEGHSSCASGVPGGSAHVGRLLAGDVCRVPDRGHAIRVDHHWRRYCQSTAPPLFPATGIPTLHASLFTAVLGQVGRSQLATQSEPLRPGLGGSRSPHGSTVRWCRLGTSSPKCRTRSGSSPLR